MRGMSRKNGALGKLALSGLLMFGSAGAIAQSPNPSQQAEEIVVTARRTGIPVWRVHGPSTTIVLIGAIEDVSKSTRWDPQALTATLVKADRVMFPSTVEVTASPFALVGYYMKWRKQATLPKGQTLASLLPVNQFQRLVALKNRGVLKPGFERMHPLHLSLKLRDIARGKEGNGPDASEYVRKAVRKHKIRTVPVKTIAAKAVAKDFFATPPSDYVPCLLASVAVVEAGPGTMKARSDAWAQRRVPDVLASPADRLRDACIPPAFEGAVPANLSGQIAALMKQPQVTVAVVQLRSLAEPGGVLDDLVAAGFDVSGPKWKR